jgi:prephenate dehydrogenase
VHVAFLGFGLISGSVALALRVRPAGYPDHGTPFRMRAWSPSGAGPAEAARAGVIDLAADSPESAIRGADLIVLGGPVPACIAMLDDLAGPWRAALAPDSVITDVASTKSMVVLRATALGLRFVGGHPMAGRESSGYGAARGDLFVDRPWVVVPSADQAAVERVESLAEAVGARPVRLSATAHDMAVAGVSHLPLVAATALVEAVAGSPDAPAAGWSDARRLAATGWRDMTRLARGDVAMGAGIATTNAPALAARLRAYIAALSAWADALERAGGPDVDAVQERLLAARAVLAETEA